MDSKEKVSLKKMVFIVLITEVWKVLWNVILNNILLMNI